MVPFIVVAGGKGLRAGGDLPKQFQLLEGKPILYHTLKSLEDAGVRECILVMDPSYTSHILPFIEGLKMSVAFVAGGAERYVSVGNGLAKIPPETQWVAIHDGVRPFISKELMERLMEKVEEGEWDYVIPGNPLKDTIKEVHEGQITGTRDRSCLYGAGTPQFVRLSLYREGMAKKMTGTDDGMVVEAMGGRGALVLNDDLNRKLTTAEDLSLAPLMYQLFKERQK